jgi:nitrite reductase/ring-hydroxylating ferredoxin subunit
MPEETVAETSSASTSNGDSDARLAALRRDRARVDAPSFGLPTAWWPVALGEEVGTKPVSVALGERSLCLFRDKNGVVHAVDDRCPHRRLPLSMGWVTEEGYIQCGYHGWCFDGATGQCTAIPNLSAEEKVSPSIRVTAFTTAENLARRLGGRPRTLLNPPAGESATDVPEGQALTLYDTVLADGFVHVWTGPAAPEAAPVSGNLAGSDAPADAGEGGAALHSVFEARAPVDDLIAALVWNPGRALGVGHLLGAGYEMVGADVDVGEGVLVVRRHRSTLDLPRVATFSPVVPWTTRVTITTRIATGLTEIMSESANGAVGARVVVGLTPVNAFRTTVRWRGEVAAPAGGLLLAADRLVAGARSRLGRTASRAEQVADEAAEVVDAGVARLRELRADHVGGPAGVRD